MLFLASRQRFLEGSQFSLSSDLLRHSIRQLTVAEGKSTYMAELPSVAMKERCRHHQVHMTTG